MLAVLGNKDKKRDLRGSQLTFHNVQRFFPKFENHFQLNLLASVLAEHRPFPKNKSQDGI